MKFHKLGLAIVDEQHRFGVLQRKRLIDKGSAPHVLVMTATPIPRTLALTLFGDLDISVIDEMPPGRTPIETRWAPDTQLAGVWEFARREIASGRQAYVIYPVIEESKQELKAATAEYERLSKNAFPKLRVGLLHGRLKNEEKDAVMERFRRGEIDILIATTVIEVGVDVPNATMMIIEHAERFGLSQLHQLRGRIGRGQGEIVLHSGGAEVDYRGRTRAHRSHGGDVKWIRDCGTGPEAARPGRIFRDTAARRRGVLGSAAAARPPIAGSSAARGLNAGRESGAGGGDCRAAGSGQPVMAEAVSIGICWVNGVG